MATTVHEPPQIETPDRGRSGNGGWRSIVPPPLVPANGDLRVATEYAPPPTSSAIWVVIFAITMMFAAFTSALFVRKGGDLEWRTFTLPSILYLNTLILIASGITLEIARRRIATFMGGQRSRVEQPARWLYITLFLGLLFIAGQYIAWQQLRAEGLYLATNPSSSFFYLLTVTHALHVIGGLGGLLYVIGKLHKSSLRRTQLEATARYWHFMSALWVYLLLLLWIKL